MASGRALAEAGAEIDVDAEAEAEAGVDAESALLMMMPNTSGNCNNQQRLLATINQQPNNIQQDQDQQKRETNFQEKQERQGVSSR